MSRTSDDEEVIVDTHWQIFGTDRPLSWDYKPGTSLFGSMLALSGGAFRGVRSRVDSFLGHWKEIHSFLERASGALGSHERYYSCFCVLVEEAAGHRGLAGLHMRPVVAPRRVTVEDRTDHWEPFVRAHLHSNHPHLSWNNRFHEDHRSHICHSAWAWQLV